MHGTTEHFSSSLGCRLNTYKRAHKSKPVPVRKIYLVLRENLQIIYTQLTTHTYLYIVSHLYTDNYQYIVMS